MIRLDNTVCGTSTTGTGTLTLAACPAPPGGIDFFAWLTATGIGFVNGNAVLVSYTIIEYTDSTFATAKATEKGVGTLTLGASLTATTLARTTVQSTATAMNTTGVPLVGGTAVSIGTAANTLVFMGASVADLMAFEPYVTTSVGDNLGAGPVFSGSSTPAAGTGLTTQQHIYVPFQWAVPMLVKRASMNVKTAYATSSPVSNAWARIYAITTTGLPGKLLYDFGLFGSANTSLNATGNISTGAAGNGYFLTPGEYYFDFAHIFSGGGTTPAMAVNANSLNTYVHSARFGTASMQPYTAFLAFTDAGAGTASDPAFTTGWTGVGSAGRELLFTLAPS